MKKFFLLFLLGLISLSSYGVYTQMKPYTRFLEEERRLSVEIENEKNIAAELEREKSYIGTDAYVEKIAREKLGYVRPDETVFINDAETN